jgi:hypothetical protein
MFKSAKIIKSRQGPASFRLAHGYTLREFAALLEIPLSTLSMAESGARLLPTEALLKLSQLELDELARNKARSPEMGYCYSCICVWKTVRIGKNNARIWSVVIPAKKYSSKFL